MVAATYAIMCRMFFDINSESYKSHSVHCTEFLCFHFCRKSRTRSSFTQMQMHQILNAIT